MRRTFLVALVVAPVFAASAAGSIATAARAASSTSFAFGFGPGTQLSSTQVLVRVRGELTVRFHGDQATGCAAHGLCGYSGTEIWQPPPSGTLITDTYRLHGKTHEDVLLELAGQPSATGAPVPGGVTTADVRTQPSGSSATGSLCTDAAPTGAAIQASVRFRTVSLTLAQATPDVIGTRCAAPLAADIAPLLARRVLDVASLSHAGTTLSLASSGAFAAHGFAGTVASTVEMTLGRPIKQSPSAGVPPRKAVRIRTVAVRYRASLSGRVALEVRGDPSSCAPLGSCGANGAFAFQASPVPGALELDALTLARRPLRDVLTALGLRRGGNPRGIVAFGLFATTRGTDAADITAGANSCHDSAPAPPAAISLFLVRGSLTVDDRVNASVLHLRCPGPVIADGTRLASGTAAPSVLGRRSATIRLGTGANLLDDGYQGRTVSSLALTIADPHVSSSVQTLPTG